MKHWQETSTVFDRLVELHEGGHAAALACVTSISGSAYRRPGARFLIADDGATLGGISGGCLEEDVRQTGLELLDSGNSRLLHYETGDDDDALWGLGLGCDGEVDVLVTPCRRAGFMDAVSAMRERLAGDAPFVAVTLLADGTMLVLGEDGDLVNPTGTEATDEALAGEARAALAEGRSRTVEIDGNEAFVEVFEPPPYMVVCGAGDDAMPMVQCAADSGFRVVVVDHRRAYLADERFPAAWKRVTALPEDDVELPASADTYVLLKTHNIARDKAWATTFLDTPIPYLGLLGPRARCEEIADEAGGDHRHRIFGPVGLDLGSEGPEQVGLAIVAELLAVRSCRRPGHLRDREAPIHDPL